MLPGAPDPSSWCWRFDNIGLGGDGYRRRFERRGGVLVVNPMANRVAIVTIVSGGCKLHICGGRKLHTRHPMTNP